MNSSFSTGPKRSRFTLAKAGRLGAWAAPRIAAADRTGDRMRQNSVSRAGFKTRALILLCVCYLLLLLLLQIIGARFSARTLARNQNILMLFVRFSCCVCVHERGAVVVSRTLRFHLCGAGRFVRANLLRVFFLFVLVVVLCRFTCECGGRLVAPETPGFTVSLRRAHVKLLGGGTRRIFPLTFSLSTLCDWLRERVVFVYRNWLMVIDKYIHV